MLNIFPQTRSPCLTRLRNRCISTGPGLRPVRMESPWRRQNLPTAQVLFRIWSKAQTGSGSSSSSPPEFSPKTWSHCPLKPEGPNRGDAKDRAGLGKNGAEQVQVDPTALKGVSGSRFKSGRGSSRPVCTPSSRGLRGSPQGKPGFPCVSSLFCSTGGDWSAHPHPENQRKGSEACGLVNNTTYVNVLALILYSAPKMSRGGGTQCREY